MKNLKSICIFLFISLFSSCGGSVEFDTNKKTKINLNEGLIISCNGIDELNIQNILLSHFASKGFSVSSDFNDNSRYLFSFSYSWRTDYPAGKVFSDFHGTLTDRIENKNVSDFNFNQGIFAGTEINEVLSGLVASLLKLNTNQFSKKNKSNSNEVKNTGSGFLISNKGYVVTNYHVIENNTKIEINFPFRNINKIANVKLKDITNDLAILELNNFNISEIADSDIPFTFASIEDVKIGQEVYTLGFPSGSFLGKDSRLSIGVIQSLYGINDDPVLFQISNPIQPGNSGGPLFNKKGELVGIVVSSLNVKYIYENIGTIPQNVNFAIKINYLENLISNLSDKEDINSRSNSVLESELEKQVEQINPFICQIKVY